MLTKYFLHVHSHPTSPPPFLVDIHLENLPDLTPGGQFLIASSFHLKKQLESQLKLWETGRKTTQ